MVVIVKKNRNYFAFRKKMRKLSELKAENAKLIKCNKNLEKDNQKLRDEVEMLHDVQTDQFEHLDNLEQYGRRENLEFEGVPQVQNEDTTEVVIKIAEKLNINLNENDISIAHRLPTKRPGKAITAVPIYQRLQSLHDLRTEEFVI